MAAARCGRYRANNTNLRQFANALKILREIRSSCSSMNAIETAIPGVLIIEPGVIRDSRGVFLELFRAEHYARHGITRPFVQDNLSHSTAGVLRGLHFQHPNPQGKLVTVLRGAILDVAVDVRTGSPTFGRHVAVAVDDQNRRQVWIPHGFAHGFVVRSEVADVFYKCDHVYSPTDEQVLSWNDPALSIDWGVERPVLSNRDMQGRPLRELGPRLPRYSARA
jgi:dTDP-4-dehydrorhamnose 3,5-epimerase